MHQVAMDPLTKFVPVIVTVMGLAVPAVALAGEIEVTAGPLMVKVREFDVTPLAGSVTLTEAEPELASKLAGTVAVMDVVELAVTVREVVTVPTFQLTVGDGVGKLVPVSTRLKLACPAIADVELRLVNDAPTLTVKF